MNSGLPPSPLLCLKLEKHLPFALQSFAQAQTLLWGSQALAPWAGLPALSLMSRERYVGGSGFLICKGIVGGARV